MAIMHFAVTAVGRSQGRSATGAAAYRAAEKIKDERTGQVHDYTRKQGVEHRELILPAGVAVQGRAEIWNKAEAAEGRKNSTVAREYEVALPAELPAQSRKQLALDFARHLAGRYGVAADVAIHRPGRGGDRRNHHAHILTTTRRISQDGTLGQKTRELDDLKTGEIRRIREAWAHLANRAMERAGLSERLDPRSLKDQGVEREPSVHLGPAAAQMERRGIQTDRGNINRLALRPDQVARRAAVASRSDLEATAGVDPPAPSAPISTGALDPGRAWAEDRLKQFRAEQEAQKAQAARAAAEARLKQYRAEQEAKQKAAEVQQNQGKAKGRDPGLGR